MWTVARHESPVVALELAADGASILSAAQDASMAVTAMDAGMLLVHSADMMDRRNGMAMSGIHSALHDVNDLAVSPRDGRMAAMMWANRLSIFATPWRQVQLLPICFQVGIPWPSRGKTARFPLCRLWNHVIKRRFETSARASQALSSPLLQRLSCRSNVRL